VTSRLTPFVVLCLIPLISGCSLLGGTGKADQDRDTRALESAGSITGDEGIVLLGGNKRRPEESGSGIAVNSYLWRASLDSIAFMPLASADPFGGVVITDWYAAPEAPAERFKVTIYILDRQLRSDGIRVSVFRQQRDASGNWIDVQVNPKTGADLENGILTRARQMRLESAARQ